MCGGIGFNFNNIPRSELERYFNDAEIEKFSLSGEVTSFFWDKQPVLPIEEGGQVKLKPWGNRDSAIRLPKTGWAKQESLYEGKWNYLSPKDVSILAQRGYEKGVWFKIKSGKIRGIEVKKERADKVYMVTKKADLNYQKLTKHNRQPVEE